MLLALGHAHEYHAPHELLIKGAPCVICQHHAAVAEPVRQGTVLWVAGYCARDGVQELPLFSCEVEVGIDDAILEEGHPRHSQRDEQLSV